MFPADRKHKLVTIEYDCRDKRSSKTFDSPYTAKSFYVFKFRDGKHPAVQRSDTMSTKTKATTKKAPVKRGAAKKLSSKKPSTKEKVKKNAKRATTKPTTKKGEKQTVRVRILKALQAKNLTSLQVQTTIGLNHGLKPTMDQEVVRGHLTTVLNEEEKGALTYQITNLGRKVLKEGMVNPPRKKK